MRRLLIAALAPLLLAGALLGAPPPLTLPAEVHGQPGAPIRIDATTPGKAVVWMALDPGLSLVPSDLLATTKSTIAVGAKPGTYRVLAVSALGDEASQPAVANVVIDGPPVPIAQQLQTAFDAEQDPGKVQQAQQLAGIYKGLATRKVADSALKTVADLAAAAQATETTLLDDTVLPKVRQTISVHLTKQLPDGPLDAPCRGRAKKALAEVAAALAGLAPTPPPPPPGPTDPLTQALQAAWSQEADPQKAAQVAQLAALYQEAAKTTVNDASLNTLQDLYETLHAAAGKLLPDGALPKVRAALAAYLVAQLGTTPTAPLDAAMRQKAGTAFAAIATALGGLK